MPFDNEAFTAWLQEFERQLIAAGLAPNQAMKFRTVYYNDSVAHFAAGDTPEDAVVKQLLG